MKRFLWAVLALMLALMLILLSGRRDITLKFVPETSNLVLYTGKNVSVGIEASRPLHSNEMLWFESSDPSVVGVHPEVDLDHEKIDPIPVRGGQVEPIWPGKTQICAVVLAKNFSHRKAIACQAVEVRQSIQ